MRWIGIDIGKDGCAAILPDLLLLDVPTAEIRRGKKKRREYLYAAMADILRPYASCAHAILEDVHSMPGEGSVSSFSFGEGKGAWMGILAALQIPYTLVAPVIWKKAMGLAVGAEKGASIVRACQLFPEAAQLLKRKKDHNRSDALLLAAWGERMIGGGRFEREIA